jgi:hypothetical protein
MQDWPGCRTTPPKLKNSPQAMPSSSSSDVQRNCRPRLIVLTGGLPLQNPPNRLLVSPPLRRFSSVASRTTCQSQVSWARRKNRPWTLASNEIRTSSLTTELSVNVSLSPGCRLKCGMCHRAKILTRVTSYELAQQQQCEGIPTPIYRRSDPEKTRYIFKKEFYRAMFPQHTRRELFVDGRELKDHYDRFLSPTGGTIS